MPLLLAADGILLVAYETEPEGREVAVVRFESPHAHYFGPPNDEALSGHSLASRGLTPYGTFEVLSSSWIRALTEMNEVHIHHDPRRFGKLRHFVFTFHDDTFELIAEGVKDVTMFVNGERPLADVLLESWANGTAPRSGRPIMDV